MCEVGSVRSNIVQASQDTTSSQVSLLCDLLLHLVQHSTVPYGAGCSVLEPSISLTTSCIVIVASFGFLCCSSKTILMAQMMALDASLHAVCCCSCLKPIASVRSFRAIVLAAFSCGVFECGFSSPTSRADFQVQPLVLTAVCQL